MLKGPFERMLIKGLLWVIIVLVGAFAVFMAGSVWEVRNKERLAWQERVKAEERLRDVTERYGALSESVERFATERGLEEEFRKRFPVAKEGEEVIVLVDAPRAAGGIAKEPPRTLWERIRSLFGF